MMKPLHVSGIFIGMIQGFKNDGLKIKIKLSKKLDYLSIWKLTINYLIIKKKKWKAH